MLSRLLLLLLFYYSSHFLLVIFLLTGTHWYSGRADICQCADIPGKFDPKKAAELKVPKGPLFGTIVPVRADACVSLFV